MNSVPQQVDNLAWQRKARKTRYKLRRSLQAKAKFSQLPGYRMEQERGCGNGPAACDVLFETGRCSRRLFQRTTKRYETCRGKRQHTTKAVTSSHRVN